MKLTAVRRRLFYAAIALCVLLLVVVAYCLRKAPAIGQWGELRDSIQGRLYSPHRNWLRGESGDIYVHLRSVGVERRPATEQWHLGLTIKRGGADYADVIQSSQSAAEPIKVASDQVMEYRLARGVLKGAGLYEISGELRFDEGWVNLPPVRVRVW